jgi:hypothetical protein
MARLEGAAAPFWRHVRDALRAHQTSAHVSWGGLASSDGTVTTSFGRAVALDFRCSDGNICHAWRSSCSQGRPSPTRGKREVRQWGRFPIGGKSERTISIGLTATAGDRTFRFRDVGADVVQIKPDGTLVLLITGQVPFAFAGVLKIDPETEEVILEPRDRSEEQLAKACGVLTGG